MKTPNIHKTIEYIASQPYVYLLLAVMCAMWYYLVLSPLSSAQVEHWEYRGHRSHLHVQDVFGT